jgi:hypothetical protein
VTRALNVWFAAWMLCWLALGATQAHAQDQKRVVVLEFKGPSSAVVRGHVVEALGDHASEVEVVPSKEAARTADQLSVTLNNADDLQRVAQELQVSAFIEGEVTKEGKNLRALVRVRNAATGEVVHEEPWTRKTKAQLKAVRGNFWEVMGPHILATEAPPRAEKPEPEPEPEPVEQTRDEEPEQEAAPEEDEAAPTGKSYTRHALQVYVGPRLMWRVLNYEGVTTLSNYKNEFGSPGVNAAVGAAWFPGAHKRTDWLSNIGLELDLDYTIGLSSKQGTEELSTTAYEFGAGAVGRVPLGSFELRVRAGYVSQKFEVEKTNTLPPVSYGSVRAGLGVAMHVIEQLTIDASINYFIVLGAGDLQTDQYASEASVSALDAGVGLLARFKGPYGARLGFDFRRYYIDFGSSSNAALTLPEKATDDYRRFTLAFVYTMAGASKE